MACSCGSKLCRKVITNKDYLNPKWQNIYGNYLPEYVLKAIELSKLEELHEKNGA